ncbi:MAG: cytochrome b/b6 domain-containing protein [Verrucomicrobiales bacterium]|nr:cytochrome b/b6 domain-containing protein [Verrucomicrobiales bacterium]
MKALSLVRLAAVLFLGTLLPARAQIDEPVPNDKCLECHGMSDLTKTNAAGQTLSLFTDLALLKASVHTTNQCIDCHRDLAKAWEHPDDGHVTEPVQCAKCHELQSATYDASVHGIALREGKLGAATCKDCHGQHDITRHSNPESRTSFAHLAETCGQCHIQEAAELQASVHGQAAARGHREAPTCIDCHAEHQIETLRTASPLKIAEQICGKCHASERVNTRFRMPRRQVDTFFESYHGLAAQGGSTRAANCASCHGWHNILASTNPDSTVNKANLVKTCGQCHPGIGENFALGKVHVDDSLSSETGLIINRWVRRIYLGMIVVVVGLLGLHNGAVWFRKVRAALQRPGRNLVRMDGPQRRQHAILAVSFILLALTGFALRFPDSWLSWIFGSEDVRRWLHRVSGAVLIGIGGWHLIYVTVTAEGRRLWYDLMPRPKDWRDLRQNVRHLAGQPVKRAQIARFGYAEKLEYWAVVWGTIIMGVTGLMIWLKVDFTRWFPRWFIDVAITIHYYEAILACLAIIVWHFYHVIFDPDVYPGNFAWLDGKVTREWQEHEHPLETPRAGGSSHVAEVSDGSQENAVHPDHSTPPRAASADPGNKAL